LSFFSSGSFFIFGPTHKEAGLFHLFILLAMIESFLLLIDIAFNASLSVAMFHDSLFVRSTFRGNRNIDWPQKATIAQR